MSYFASTVPRSQRLDLKVHNGFARCSHRNHLCRLRHVLAGHIRFKNRSSSGLPLQSGSLHHPRSLRAGGKRKQQQ
eukprot:3900982-Amphidinium_carterae.1